MAEKPLTVHSLKALIIQLLKSCTPILTSVTTQGASDTLGGRAEISTGPALAKKSNGTSRLHGKNSASRMGKVVLIISTEGGPSRTFPADAGASNNPTSVSSPPFPHPAATSPHPRIMLCI